MITSLKLGNKKFPINMIQGPLAGVSCAPFRRLMWEHSAPAFSCTEMISAKTIIHQPQKRLIYKDPKEGPVCFQLSSSDPYELAEATKHATSYGADLIDLNCGCPVNKIRRKGAGSSLLTTPKKLFQLICAMKQNTTLPISIKIRVQQNNHEMLNSEIVKAVSDAGADFLIVHGRHWTENYEIPCRYDQIQFFVNELKIPVIGNGDIACVTSLKKMFATGCAGVMIGRAGVGQPWLIQKLVAEIRGVSFIPLTHKQTSDIFIEHVFQLIQLLKDEKLAILQARKLAKYYARDLMNKIEFCAAVNQCEQFDVFKTLCHKFFTELS